MSWLPSRPARRSDSRDGIPRPRTLPALAVAGSVAAVLAPLAVAVTSAPPAEAAPRRIFWVATNGSDANPGTKARPLATIRSASGKARPGDSVYVRGGTYYLKSTQYIATKGTARAPVTYRSAPGERAVLDGSRMSDGNMVDIRGRYNIFRNFEVRGAKNFCIITLGAMHSQILSNTVHGCWQSAIGIEGGKIGGDPNPWAVGMKVVGNHVYDNVRAKKANPRAEAAPSVHADYAQNVTFANNRIHDNHQIGLELAIVRGALVSGNTMYGNELHLHLDNASGVTVRDNFLLRGRSKLPNTGIQTANIDWKDSNPLRKLTVRNNVVVGGHFGFMYGTYGRGGGLKDSVIEGNTFYGATEWVLLVAADRGHVRTRFSRNIFVKGGARHDVDVPRTPGLRFAKNCWSGGPAGRARGAGDVNAAPRFVRPGTFSLAGYRQRADSPCRAMGARPRVAPARAVAAAPTVRAAAAPAGPAAILRPARAGSSASPGSVAPADGPDPVVAGSELAAAAAAPPAAGPAPGAGNDPVPVLGIALLAGLTLGGLVLRRRMRGPAPR